MSHFTDYVESRLSPGSAARLQSIGVDSFASASKQRLPHLTEVLGECDAAILLAQASESTDRCPTCGRHNSLPE